MFLLSSRIFLMSLKSSTCLLRVLLGCFLLHMGLIPWFLLHYWYIESYLFGCLFLYCYFDESEYQVWEFSYLMFQEEPMKKHSDISISYENRDNLLCYFLCVCFLIILILLGFQAKNEWQKWIFSIHFVLVVWLLNFSFFIWHFITIPVFSS